MTDAANGALEASDPTGLQQLQFDYAWKWFSFHADQRIKMFNYMLVVFGVFIAGIVSALDKKISFGLIGGLCFVAGGVGAHIRPIGSAQSIFGLAR
jgi:hypothetical protein